VASDTGELLEFDPVDGDLLGTVSLPSGAATNPVVAGGTLYLVTENGTLHAFR
jgi:outer membrane protein assembly factor BamB